MANGRAPSPPPAPRECSKPANDRRRGGWALAETCVGGLTVETRRGLAWETGRGAAAGDAAKGGDGHACTQAHTRSNKCLL